MRPHGFFAPVVVAAAMVVSTALAHAAPPPVKTSARAQQNWFKALQQLHPKPGCYKAVFPKPALTAVKCITAPDIPFTVGGSSKGNDYSATGSGQIESAQGLFSTSGLTSESGSYYGVETPNSYSLQLNSNPFASAACNGHPSCKAEQQFVYASQSHMIVMQYWLANYGSPCPSGWTQSGGKNCRMNSRATQAGLLAITGLENTAMFASARSDYDYLLFQVSGLPSVFVVESDKVLGLSQGWKIAEYNVFGEGKGVQANFNSGTTIWVHLEIFAGNYLAPTCARNTFTGETNNLTLSYTPPPDINEGALPSISFMESLPAGTQAAQCFTSE